jgi:hypothetical protein
MAFLKLLLRRAGVVVKLNLHKEAMRSNLLPDENPFSLSSKK